mgnify:FL=1
MYKHYRESWNYSRINPYPDYNDMIKYTDSKLLPLGFEKEEIGLSQDGEFMMYAYKKNLDKPIFWLDSNIHGSEWWTCYYCLDFLTAVWGDTYFDKKVSKLIRDNFGMYYIPSVNPWGYHNVKYYQSRGVNLNRNFNSRFDDYQHGNAQWEGNNYKGTEAESEQETKNIVSAFNKIKPYIAINCHTTTGNGSGVDLNNKYPEYSLLTTDVHNSIKLTYPEAGTLEWNGQYTPSAQAWYGMQTSKEGTNVITSILEHQSDTDKYNVGYTTLFIIALTTINWKNNNRLKLNHIEELIS